MAQDDPSIHPTGRVPLVADGESSELEVLFEEMRSSNRRVANVQRAIGNSPPTAIAFARFADRARSVSWMAAADVELVILRVATLTACPYPFSHHVAPAIRAGLTEEQIVSLWDWRSVDCFTPEQRLLLRAVDDIEGGAGLSASTYRALAERFSPREIVELTTLTGFYGLLARLANSLGAPVDDDVRVHVDRLWPSTR